MVKCTYECPNCGIEFTISSKSKEQVEYCPFCSEDALINISAPEPQEEEDDPDDYEVDEEEDE